MYKLKIKIPSIGKDDTVIVQNLGEFKNNREVTLNEDQVAYFNAHNELPIDEAFENAYGVFLKYIDKDATNNEAEQSVVVDDKDGEN